MITRHPFHAELEALVRPENHVPSEGFSEESPSGRFRFDTEVYACKHQSPAEAREVLLTDEGGDIPVSCYPPHTTRQIVLVDQVTDERFACLYRDDERFDYGWIERDGEEYLLFAAMYEGGETVVNLSQHAVSSYYPANDFIWVEFFPSPSGQRLAIKGCYWACNFMVVIYDFLEPMRLPLPKLAEIMFEGEERTCEWLSDTELLLKDRQGNPGRVIAVA